MTRVPSRPSVAEVLACIEAELEEAPESLGSLRARLHRVRHQLDHFRLEPVGGRLAGVKKIPYWFVASAFDRQGKILEEICELLEETISEMEMLKGSVDMEHVPRTGRDEPRRRQDPGSAT